MGLLDSLKHELLDIVEFLDPTKDTLVYRFERYKNEIKDGAKLVVRESQVAVFINEGKLADVYTPGTYTLNTQNMPILATLKGWKYGFESPFKVEVYFVNTRIFTDQKWGTPNPVMMRDKEFGPVRIRAFGSYTFNVTDAGKFVIKIAGTGAVFTVDEINSQLRNILVARFSDSLAQSQIPVLDMASNYDEVGAIVETRVKPEFDEYGLNLSKFLIGNVTLPEEVEKMMDKRTSMGVLGDLDKYTKFQVAESIQDAAKNPSGLAGTGMALGAGFGIANQVAQTFAQAGAPSPNTSAPAAASGSAVTPPPLPGTVSYFVAVDGKQQGPYDISFLRQLVSSNQLTRDTLIWKEGMAAWASAGTAPELQTIFPQMPPPLPNA